MPKVFTVVGHSGSGKITLVEKLLRELSGRGLRGVLQQLDVRYVDEAEMLKADPHLHSFFDLDTPQDVAAARNGVR